MKKILGSILLGIGLLPVYVLAQEPTPPASPINSFEDIVGLLNKAIQWMYTIFFIVAVGYILWAAYDFLTFGGEPKKVEDAKSKLKYAVIAIVVALVATGVSSIVASILTQ